MDYPKGERENASGLRRRRRFIRRRRRIPDELTDAVTIEGGTLIAWDSSLRQFRISVTVSHSFNENNVCTGCGEMRDYQSVSIDDQIALTLLLNLDSRGKTPADVTITLNGCAVPEMTGPLFAQRFTNSAQPCIYPPNLVLLRIQKILLLFLFAFSVCLQRQTIFFIFDDLSIVSRNKQPPMILVFLIS